jgi:hypothetical protein
MAVLSTMQLGHKGRSVGAKRACMMEDIGCRSLLAGRASQKVCETPPHHRHLHGHHFLLLPLLLLPLLLPHSLSLLRLALSSTQVEWIIR